MPRLTGGNRIVVVGTNLGGADIITGGAGDDTINSGSGNDTVIGGAVEPTPSVRLEDPHRRRRLSVADILHGGSSTDSAVLSTWTDFIISLTASTYTIADDRGIGFDGTDSVTNVEIFQFSNGTFTASQS